MEQSTHINRLDVGTVRECWEWQGHFYSHPVQTCLTKNFETLKEDPEATWKSIDYSLYNKIIQHSLRDACELYREHKYRFKSPTEAQVRKIAGYWTNPVHK